MKSVLVTAMFALIGFSLTSAASLNLGDNEVPESMENFKESVKTLFGEMIKQIEENAAFDENTDFEKFTQENKLDDKEVSIDEEVTTNDLSVAEEDMSTENVEGGMHCHWRGLTAHCCRMVPFHAWRLAVCIKAKIHPSTGMRIYLFINGHYIWKHWMQHNHNYRVCLTSRHLRICFTFTHVYISRHYARVCVKFFGNYHHVWYHKFIGCLGKHYAQDAIATAEETPIQHIKDDKIDDVISFSKENKQTKDFFAFE